MKTIEPIKLDIGMTVFKDVIPASVIAKLNEEIDNLAKNLSPSYKVISNEDVKDLLCELRTLRNYCSIEKYCRRVSRIRFLATFKKVPLAGETCYVRCAHNRSNNDSHNRHFDSFVMTILVPIKTSDSKIDNGDLVFYKKKNCAVSTLKNVIRKIVTKIDQLLPFVLRKRKTAWHFEKKLCERITCEVGNVYFFNGYNIKHCNLSVSDGERRTLLLHAYDAGNSLGISSFMRLFR